MSNAHTPGPARGRPRYPHPPSLAHTPQGPGQRGTRGGGTVGTQHAQPRLDCQMPVNGAAPSWDVTAPGPVSPPACVPKRKRKREIQGNALKPRNLSLPRSDPLTPQSLPPDPPAWPEGLWGGGEGGQSQSGGRTWHGGQTGPPPPTPHGVPLLTTRVGSQPTRQGRLAKPRALAGLQTPLRAHWSQDLGQSQGGPGPSNISLSSSPESPQLP